MTYVLHYAPDNASLIVRLALDELGASYHAKLVDRSISAQKSQTYLALNPAGRIPVLETPSGPIFETAAILLWLADQHGGLAPRMTDPKRTIFMSWLFYVSNTLHADLVSLFYPDRFVDASALDDYNTRTRARLDHAFRLLDHHAAEWSAADHGVTILDLYMAVIVRWCQLYPVSGQAWFDLNAYPALLRVAKTVETRPSAQRAIVAEGLNTTPFSAADYAAPPEGSAV